MSEANSSVSVAHLSHRKSSPIKQSLPARKEDRHYYVYMTKPGCKPGQAGVLDFLEFWWYRFELQSNLYMLDNTEKTIICTIINLVISVDFLLLSVMIFGWYSSIKFIRSIVTKWTMWLLNKLCIRALLKLFIKATMQSINALQIPNTSLPTCCVSLWRPRLF